MTYSYNITRIIIMHAYEMNKNSLISVARQKLVTIKRSCSPVRVLVFEWEGGACASQMTSLVTRRDDISVASLSRRGVSQHVHEPLLSYQRWSAPWRTAQNLLQMTGRLPTSLSLRVQRGRGLQHTPSGRRITKSATTLVRNARVFLADRWAYFCRECDSMDTAQYRYLTEESCW